MPVDIVIEDPAWTAADVCPEAEALVAEAVARALAHVLGTAAGGAEVAVLLTCDADIAALNAEWRGKDGPTNVLSFPTLAAPAARALAAGGVLDAGALPHDLSEEAGFPLGDVILARETIVREAAVQGKDIARHVAHLCVHGTLHLLGYDHMADDEAREMEGLEIAILAAMGVPDPYGGDTQPEDTPARARTTT
ncbi:MAG: rRNA maturation RNase YbeY [Alphaproteobacteria bacterium]|nr:rRNA maturation RNase YbeY [Alphaproteobacteria bacterium]MDX5369201.1 rRNA maturation RNase YbeY [Alphaproteobacteria bacterium]MDX5463897.1 rRNA maturation RNase YbeY [Alphaproteobacteria bacterium]